MAEVVLTTLGTWGDVFPTIGVAKHLIGAGRSVRIAAPAQYRALIEAEHVPFSPLGPPQFSDYATDLDILSRDPSSRHSDAVSRMAKPAAVTLAAPRRTTRGR